MAGVHDPPALRGARSVAARPTSPLVLARCRYGFVLSPPFV
jgi:hypothetical protein